VLELGALSVGGGAVDADEAAELLPVDDAFPIPPPPPPGAAGALTDI